MSFKEIIIIGASSGIGRALALYYGKNPDVRLGLAARREHELRQLATRIPAKCEVCHLDLDTPDRASRFAELLKLFPQPDLIIYCSGFGEINPSMDWELCRQTLEVNVNAFTEIANASYLYMAERKHGHYAAISSVSGLRGAEDDSGYSASKAYMISYMEGLERKAHREHSGITFSTILPGYVDTAMAKSDSFFWMCSPETAASQIASGLERRKHRFYVTRRWRLVGILLQIIPWQIYKRL